jgi:hypothetical protein
LIDLNAPPAGAADVLFNLSLRNFQSFAAEF